MILELIDFQFSIILHKKRCKDTKKYSNYQISVFYIKKKHTRVITTLYAQTKSIIYCLT